MSDSAASSHAEEEMEAATEVSGDLLDKIVVLDRMVRERRENPEARKRYEQLRDEVMKALESQGSRYYVDELGHKRIAYAVRPEGLWVDIEGLIEAWVDGRLPALDIDTLFPRKADLDRVRAAVATEAIPPWAVVRYLKIYPKTGHVAFMSDAPGEDE